MMMVKTDAQRSLAKFSIYHIVSYRIIASSAGGQHTPSSVGGGGTIGGF
jgi:hypothetical protein